VKGVELRGSKNREEYESGSSSVGLSDVLSSASSYREVSDSVSDGSRKVFPSRDVVFLGDYASVLLAVSCRMCIAQLVSVTTLAFVVVAVDSVDVGDRTSLDVP
jgi:hypothetical protein